MNQAIRNTWAVVVALFTGALALSLGHLQVRRVAALVLPVLDRLVKESERLDESVRPEPQPATGVCVTSAVHVLWRRNIDDQILLLAVCS